MRKVVGWARPTLAAGSLLAARTVPLTALVALVGAIVVTVAGSTAATCVAAADPVSSERDRLQYIFDQAQSDQQEARKLGARQKLSRGYGEVGDLLSRAEELLKDEAASPAELEGAVTEASVGASLLLNRARFVKEMEAQRDPWEAALGRFDQSLLEIALAGGFTLDPTLTGPGAARALLDSLDRRRVRRRVQMDSLMVAHRHCRRQLEARRAERDSLVTALQVEVNSLRRQLWDTEVRAGLAEADRSAAAADLNQRRQKEEAVRLIGQSFGPEEATVLLTPEGKVILRVFGFAFGVGSASLKDEGEPLLSKLVEAIELFPGCSLRIEGHSDATGSRDHNLRLSRRRAETVAGLLAARFEPPPHMETIGYGPDHPIAPNSTEEGRSRNRRIDVIIAPR